MDLARVPPLDRLSARRRPVVAVAMLFALVLVGALVVLAVVRATGPRPGAVDQARPGAVIMVPGYGGSQASLAGLADRLRAAGRAVTVVALPGVGNGDLHQQA